MSELPTVDNLSKIQNKSLGNDFINELIVKHNTSDFFAFFDEYIVLIDNTFSKYSGQEIKGKENVRVYLETLFKNNPEIFKIKSRELKVEKKTDHIYNILITLKGVFCKDSKNSILKVQLGTKRDNNNCYLINSITLHSIERAEKELNKMNGGLISFSFNKFFSLEFISEELLSFLKYEHKGEMISDLDGRLSSAIRIEDIKALKSTIDDSIKAKTYFKTSINIKNAVGNYVCVNILGQSLKFTDNKNEVFAIICEKTLDFQIHSFSDNISAQLISLAQSYHNPIFWKDTSGKYLGCNVSFLEKFNINRVKDLINKDDSIFFDKEISAKHLQENQRLIIGNETQLNITESLNINGNTFYINTTRVPLYRSGAVVGIIGFVFDVTKEEKNKQTIVQQEAEINYIFSLSSHGYFIKDANLKFLKVNKIFSEMVNISIEEIIGKSNEELFIYGLDASLSEKEILKTKKKVSFTYTKTINKAIRYFMVTENPLLDDRGELLKIIGNIIDTTDEINNRLKLKKDYHRLISVLNEKQNISFITIDMTTRIITSYAQKGSTHNIVGLVYAENLIKYNASKFLYQEEKYDFLDKFSYDSLLEINKTDEEVKRIYTIKRYDNTLIKVLFTADFNINPFTSHLEATIKSTDITESQFALEVVNSFDMREYDFIVRLSTSIDTFIVVYSDKSQYDFTGYENDNCVDKFLDVLYKNSTSTRPKTMKWVNDLRECFKPNAEWNFDIDTKDGLRKNIIVRPLNEEKQSVIIVSQDITVRTKQNKAIQLKLEKLAKEAVAANNVKTDFLARMSHDMRTPLSAIMGLTDFGISESKDKNLTSYFEKIKNSGEYLKTLLNDVLDMHVIEKGNLVLNPKNVLMQEKIKNVKTIISPRAIEKNITLTINRLNLVPSYISIDAQRAEQVLVNLLTNALKYTKPNGHIDWIIEFIDGDAPFVRHIIRDDGVGMSKNFQKHMFDNFSREDNMFSSAEGGSGIGLAIVKNIINVMAGSIRCESELGVGTTFEIELPVTPISKEEYESNLSKKKGYNSKLLENRKILVCEDNPINIVIIQKILSQYNMSVDVANKGELGVKFALDNDYDAILMDIRMPVMNGLDAAKAIRLKNKNIPIIAISANAYEKDIEQSLSSGMNAHLSKPINKEELFYTLANLLKD